MNISNPFLLAAPLFMFAMGLEIFIDRRKHLKIYQWKDFWANLGIGAGDVGIGLLSTYVHVGISFFLYDRFMPLREEWLGYGTLGWAWWVWVLCFFLDDFSYYWFHRLSHEVRLLWAGHVVHHSSTHLNFSTAFRNSWVSIIYKPFFWYWLPFLGFSPIMVNFFMSISSIYQFFCHTQLAKSWGRLGTVLVTPRSHLVHHGVNPQYIDKNFGGILIVYDRLFGTFQAFDPAINIEFGVTKPPRSNNLLEITFHEFRDLKGDLSRTRQWRKRLAILFGAPGKRLPKG